MKTSIGFFLCVLLSSFVSATEIELSFGIGTTHFGPSIDDQPWNNDNDLVALKVGPVHAVSFVNSYYEESYAFGVNKMFQLRNTDRFDATLYAGMTHGYNPDYMPACIGDFCPYVAAAARMHLDEHVNVQVNWFGKAVFYTVGLRKEF